MKAVNAEAKNPTSFWFWGCSSAGRAAALQAVGSGFESCHLHQSFNDLSNTWVFNTKAAFNEAALLLIEIS